MKKNVLDFIGSIPEFLRWLREETGLSREDMARRIGISRPFFTYIEQGKRRPSIETLEKLLKLVDKDATIEIVPDMKTLKKDVKELAAN